LEQAGLLRQEKEGRIRRCRLVVDPLKDAAAWIAYYQQFWADQFEALADYLQDSTATDEAG
jgi:DNA-binding transcriptional ArsR family regulator